MLIQRRLVSQVFNVCRSSSIKTSPVIGCLRRTPTISTASPQVISPPQTRRQSTTPGPSTYYASLRPAMPQDEHILTLSCPDKPGIVHAVTSIFAQRSINVLDLQQFSDPDSKKFFMRVRFGPIADPSTDLPTKALEDLAAELKCETYAVHPAHQKTRVLILVSKIGHCLNDLLFRAKVTGQLHIDVPLVVSNHPDFKPLVESNGIEFMHLPVSKETKAAQEQQILDLVKEHKIELVVLARYMQVLSPILCQALKGRIINIHHSFLPAFIGAKPYHKAHERGVKIIGATAHFVTEDLDEGPIIEQRVTRVNHSMQPQDLVEEGSNVESQVLAAAVKWVVERRVFINGHKTVIFN